MALIQIEEAELLQQKNVIDTLNKMLGNPEARRKVLEARKITDPNVSIPELDAAAPLNNALGEIQKELRADREARKAEAIARDQERRLDEFNAGLESQRRGLRAEGWTDEGLEQLQEHAQKYGIPNLELAAPHFLKLHPPADPVQPNGSGSWGFFEAAPAEDTFIKAMLESQGNDERALNSEIQKALAETRGQARR
jgi:hypothetical protein